MKKYSMILMVSICALLSSCGSISTTSLQGEANSTATEMQNTIPAWSGSQLY